MKVEPGSGQEGKSATPEIGVRVDYKRSTAEYKRSTSGVRVEYSGVRGVRTPRSLAFPPLVRVLPDVL
jgi:hypothetical protein